jgi:hypothetical protein
VSVSKATRCIYVKKKNLYLLFHQGVLCQVVLCQVALCQVALCQVALCQVALCRVALCQVALCQVALYRLYHREVLYLVALNGVS